MTEVRKCAAVWCGQMQYPQALQLQLKISGLKKRGFDIDVLLLLEHPPVITLGRGANRKHLLADETYLKCKGIDLLETDRGGDITFHGPGQLVGYPILELQHEERDVRSYMRRLEESLIRLLDRFGIKSSRDPGFTGVWTQNGKIGALGVHISRWITSHGFALNVNTDLSFFNLIVPCGIEGRGIASMNRFIKHDLKLEDVAEKYIHEFGFVFNRHIISMTAESLTNELNKYEAYMEKLNDD